MIAALTLISDIREIVDAWRDGTWNDNQVAAQLEMSLGNYKRAIAGIPEPEPEPEAEPYVGEPGHDHPAPCTLCRRRTFALGVDGVRRPIGRPTELT